MMNIYGMRSLNLFFYFNEGDWLYCKTRWIRINSLPGRSEMLATRKVHMLGFVG